MLKKLIQAFRRPQLRLRVMSEEDKVRRFAEIPASQVWPAVLAELDEFLIDQSDQMVDEDNPNRLLKIAGGQEALLDFKNKLMKRDFAARGVLSRKPDETEEETETAGA